MIKPVTDDKIEKLAFSIQNYLSGNPAFLIGSGCSIPYGLPSMNELSEEIVHQLDSAYYGDSTWQEFLEQLKINHNLEIALEAVTMREDIHESIIKVVWSYIQKKDNEAFLRFIISGSFPELAKIIKKCIQSIPSTNIVTTNYDRLIEYSIDAAGGRCVSGFSGNYIKHFQNFEGSAAKRVINLYKVHGSVDWFKHKVTGSTIATYFFDVNDYRDIYNPMIVTPGRMKYKETHNDPFRTVIFEADKAIRASTSYLCIGYGFNDDHIQPIILDENRNNHKPIVIVTKAITDKMVELFHSTDDAQCLIISENNFGGGTTVYYNKTDKDVFDEQFWQLNMFSKLWLG